MNSAIPLPTIEEYLNLSDWVFRSKIENGQHEEFFWVQLPHFIDFADYVELPQQPYRILITTFDGTAASNIATDPGWRPVGDFALSELVSTRPEINYGANTEFMLLDKPPGNEEKLIGNCLNGEKTDPEDPKFWQFLRRFQPYCFVSFQNGVFFASPHKHFVELLQSEKVLADIKQHERDHLSKYRARTWSSLGPECGPETCIEEGCKRLRIKLAVRCFMHQMR